VSRLRILLVNEPRVYREALAAAFQAFKSTAEVVTSRPEQLDSALESFAPHVVVCSRLTSAVRNNALSWVELYPNYAALAHINVAGKCSTMEGVELPDLLRVLDQTENMVEAD
jgi:hypothetical protein